jgi:hypothetical protein
VHHRSLLHLLCPGLCNGRVYKIAKIECPATLLVEVKVHETEISSVLIVIPLAPDAHLPPVYVHTQSLDWKCVVKLL